MTFDEWIEKEINKEHRFAGSDSLYRFGYKFYDKIQAAQIATNKNHYEEVMKKLSDDCSYLQQSEHREGLEGQLKTAKLERVDLQLKQMRQKYLECIEARDTLKKEYNKEVA